MLIFIVLPYTVSPFVYAMLKPHGSKTFWLSLNKLNLIERCSVVMDVLTPVLYVE